MKETAADRLKALRVKRGFETAQDAATAFGWNPVTYRSHENGTREIGYGPAKRYAERFSTTSAYILEGKRSGVSPSINVVAILSLFAKVAAGAFRYDEAEDALKEVDVPAVPRNDIPVGSQYALQIDGPSVNRRIPDGAYAICALFDSYPGGAQHGQLVHVIRERAGLREHTIKELQFTKDGMVLMPCSTDPRYQEQVKLSTGDDGEIVSIHGVVIGQFQPM